MANKSPKKSTPQKKKSVSKKSKNNINKPTNAFGVYSASGLLVTAFLAIFIYINMDGSGIIGGAIRNVLFGVFGFMAYFLPILIGGVTIYYIINKLVKDFWLKILYGFGAIVASGAFLSIIFRIENYYAYHWGKEGIGGGFIGTVIASFLISLIQKPATILVLILLFVLCISKLTNVLIYSYIGKWCVIGAKKSWTYIKGLISEIKNGEYNKPKEKVNPLDEEKLQHKERKRHLIFNSSDLENTS
ncbi:MAG: DNA translocase FtsK 4TM domain-containing protein, partial [Clostridia bacterium]|nr:DNA translocase FtsK 4TM domain-containing protein [Clostridia bacterium]